MYAQPIQTRQPVPAGPTILERLNGVAFSAGDLQGALEQLAALPPAMQANGRVQAVALQAFARESGLGDDPLVSAALHARVTALAKWTAANDPERQSNAEAVIDAAARFPLCELPDGIGFEPAGFQEMILFIEELPW